MVFSLWKGCFRTAVYIGSQILHLHFSLCKLFAFQAFMLELQWNIVAKNVECFNVRMPAERLQVLCSPDFWWIVNICVFNTVKHLWSEKRGCKGWFMLMPRTWTPSSKTLRLRPYAPCSFFSACLISTRWLMTLNRWSYVFLSSITLYKEKPGSF